MATTPSTRAVLRRIEPGSDADCPRCKARVKFEATKHLRKVICNIYGRHGDATVWDRLEEWHEACYIDEGQPYGDPDDSKQRADLAGFTRKPRVTRA